MPRQESTSSRVGAWLALERNVSVILVVLFLLGMGEELWTRFIPKYLEVLGGGAWVVASYGTLKDFLDAVYQYPGGWLADRIGRRASLIVFTLLAIVGYGMYYAATSWLLILFATIFVMAWSSLTLPAVFSIIGDRLAEHRRAMGFGVQSLLKRIPIVIAPTLGGLLLTGYGFMPGIRIGLLWTILGGVIAISTLIYFYDEQPSPPRDELRFIDIWRVMNPALKKLLVTDILARWAEGLAEVFIIIYAMNILRTSAFQFGWLISIQMLVSIVLYIPISHLADRWGRRPFVFLTFVFFAVYPLSIAFARGIIGLAIAFIIGGLREIGEPARKASIIDMTRSDIRARTVGAYYLVRGLAVFPASMVAGVLWNYSNRLPFVLAFIIGLIGAGYYLLVESKKVAGQIA
ncbi:MAG TPA: MFS transporter [Bacteroidota bacterium]|nr:MFS transporter [Bacteroidota bacterium]